MLEKRLRIKLFEENQFMGKQYPLLYDTDYPNIYLDHEITEEEFDEAVNVIITKFMQDKLSEVEIFLKERNEAFAKPKEMSIKDIEKELGYKIKIVDKKRRSDTARI